jgi:hypothetical protein
MKQPTAVDLFCGLGGWTEGLLAEGYRVVGIDIEEHVYGEHRYPAKLMLADVLTLHGSLFARADLIVASPPCQEYSYMAMPWKRAKAKAAAIRADQTGQEMERLTRLFRACFRIQKEASEAAGRHIPMVVEKRARRSAVGRQGARQLRIVLSMGRRAGADAGDVQGHQGLDHGRGLVSARSSEARQGARLQYTCGAQLARGERRGAEVGPCHQERRAWHGAMDQSG